MSDGTKSAASGGLRRLLVEPTDSTAVQFVRYLFVGGVAFSVDFGLLWLLTESVGLHYLFSAALAFMAGLVTNYALSVVWVFNRRTLSNRAAEFGLFAVVGIVGLGLNEVVIWAMTEQVGMHYLGSKLVATAVVYFWNFGARKMLLFR